MIFIFYPTHKEAEDKRLKEYSTYTVAINEEGYASCYGGGGCVNCELTDNICGPILLPLCKPNTTLELTKATHPEYFI